MAYTVDFPFVCTDFLLQHLASQKKEKRKKKENKENEEQRCGKNKKDERNNKFTEIGSKLKETPILVTQNINALIFGRLPLRPNVTQANPHCFSRQLLHRPMSLRPGPSTEALYCHLDQFFNASIFGGQESEWGVCHSGQFFQAKINYNYNFYYINYNY